MQDFSKLSKLSSCRQSPANNSLRGVKRNVRK
nr:MAG TPA: hypothetical protein [Caudoviricetes sp.]